MRLAIPENQRRTITLAALPDGVDGIKATLALMVKLARQSRNNFEVRNLALQLVQPLPQKDWLGQVKAIHEFVRDRVRYVHDINGVETLATPMQTMQIMQGDCDDKALLTAALLDSIGHPVRFVAVGKQPGEYEHVYVETKMGDKWVPVETTEPVPLGWSPPGMKSVPLIYHV